MKSRIPLLSILLILLSLGLSACAGGSAASSWPGLTVEGETAYLAFNQHVYAINTTTGTEIWRYPNEANAKISFYAAPVLTPDGQLLVSGYDKVLYSLDPQNGTEKWKFTEGENRYIGSPLASENGIYAPNADNSLYALDNQGKRRWKFTTEAAPWAQPMADPACECVYLTAMDQRIYAINAQSGNQEWQTEKLGGSIVGTPAYSSDGVLYTGTFDKTMVAITAANGRVLWSVPTDGLVWGGPALKDGNLYFGDLSGAFYSMDTARGGTNWKINPDGPITQTPLLTDEAIYFTTKAGTLYAVDYSGKILWNPLIGGKLYTSPVLAGDKILVAPTGLDELVVAVDKNGITVWKFIPEAKK